MESAGDIEELFNKLKFGYNEIASKFEEREGKRFEDSMDFEKLGRDLGEAFGTQLPSAVESLLVERMTEYGLGENLPEGTDIRELAAVFAGNLLQNGPSLDQEAFSFLRDIGQRNMDNLQQLVNEVVFDAAMPFIAQLDEYQGNLDIVGLYIKQALNLITQSQFNKEAAAMGFEIYERDENGEIKIPPLNQFMPEITRAFTGYLREQLPRMFGEGFDEERLNAIIGEVKDNLSEDPPNMAGIWDMMSQIDLSDENKNRMMRDMKDYFTHLISDILDSMGFPEYKREEAVASMAYALGSLSDEDYLNAMGGAFGGNGDISAVEDFLYGAYELPDVERISFEIFDQVTNYMYENLPNLGLGEDQVQFAVQAVQDELRAERGPDFYKLPGLMTELQIPEEAQVVVIEELNNFLQRQMVEGVRRIEGVPQDVKTIMIRAMKGALDFVLNDIRPDSVNVDFFEMIPQFNETIGNFLIEDLSQIEWIAALDKQERQAFLEQVLSAVGYQFQREGGPAFEELVTSPALVLLEPAQIGELMTRVRDGIIKGSEQAVFDLAMEEKYQRAAMRALSQGMEYLSHQFEAFMHHSTEGAGGHGGDTTETGFWEPPRFEEAVCCMPGMPCWTGDFASAAGRAKIVADIEAFRAQLVGAKELYDELNAENEREAAAERAVALAEARDNAARLTNQIRDAEKREQKAQEVLSAAFGAELATAAEALEEAKAATELLREEKRFRDEESAQLTKEDAEGAVLVLDAEYKQRTNEIAGLEAEIAYEKNLATGFKATMDDESKTLEERDVAK